MSLLQRFLEPRVWGRLHCRTRVYHGENYFVDLFLYGLQCPKMYKVPITLADLFRYGPYVKDSEVMKYVSMSGAEYLSRKTSEQDLIGQECKGIDQKKGSGSRHDQYGEYDVWKSGILVSVRVFSLIYSQKNSLPVASE